MIRSSAIIFLPSITIYLEGFQGARGRTEQQFRAAHYLSSLLSQNLLFFPISNPEPPVTLLRRCRLQGGGLPLKICHDLRNVLIPLLQPSTAAVKVACTNRVTLSLSLSLAGTCSLSASSRAASGWPVFCFVFICSFFLYVSVRGPHACHPDREGALLRQLHYRWNLVWFGREDLSEGGYYRAVVALQLQGSTLPTPVCEQARNRVPSFEPI